MKSSKSQRTSLTDLKWQIWELSIDAAQKNDFILSGRLLETARYIVQLQADMQSCVISQRSMDAGVRTRLCELLDLVDRRTVTEPYLQGAFNPYYQSGTHIGTQAGARKPTASPKKFKKKT